MSGRGRGAPFGNSSKKQLRWLDFSLCNLYIECFISFMLYFVVYFCFFL